MRRPTTTILGPIFAKELVEMSRRPRYYFSRTLYGLGLGAVLFLIWADYDVRGPRSNNVMARLAEHLFLAASIVQYGAVFLFVPLFLCGVISGEREERTLELVFTTDLTNREIVLGKLASRLAAFPPTRENMPPA